MPDPLVNLYAPPAAPSVVAQVSARGHSRSDYAGERRSVVLLLLFCVLTFGLFSSVWYIRRTRFLDALGGRKKMGALPWVSLSLVVAITVLSAAHAPDVTKLVQIAGGLLSLFLSFRVAGILRLDFARSGRPIGVSGAGVFFFGCLYLQHVMNEAADIRPYRGE